MQIIESGAEMGRLTLNRKSDFPQEALRPNIVPREQQTQTQGDTQWLGFPAHLHQGAEARSSGENHRVCILKEEEQKIPAIRKTDAAQPPARGATPQKARYACKNQIADLGLHPSVNSPQKNHDPPLHSLKPEHRRLCSA